MNDIEREYLESYDKRNGCLIILVYLGVMIVMVLLISAVKNIFFS